MRVMMGLRSNVKKSAFFSNIGLQTLVQVGNRPKKLNEKKIVKLRESSGSGSEHEATLGEVKPTHEENTPSSRFHNRVLNECKLCSSVLQSSNKFNVSRHDLDRNYSES